MLTLLLTLALHGVPAPRPAHYSPHARDVSYERRMLVGQCIPVPDGHGWVAPLPYPHHRHRRG